MVNIGFRRETNPSVKSEIHYDLPLDITQISNFQDVSSAFQLNEEAKNILKRNGFAVISHPAEQFKSTSYYPRVSELFKKVRMFRVPVFVTSDSLLHVFHSILDNLLKILEEEDYN